MVIMNEWWRKIEWKSGTVDDGEKVDAVVHSILPGNVSSASCNLIPREVQSCNTNLQTVDLEKKAKVLRPWGMISLTKISLFHVMPNNNNCTLKFLLWEMRPVIVMTLNFRTWKEMKVSHQHSHNVLVKDAFQGYEISQNSLHSPEIGKKRKKRGIDD